MDTHQRRQTEGIIDIKEVIWNLMEQWKAVLIVALLMALLVPCAKYFKDNKDYLTREELIAAEKQSVPNAEQSINDALSPLSDDEKAVVEYIIGQHEWIAKEKKYLKDSVLAQTDPTNQRVLRLIYDIDCENKEDFSVLTYIYSTYTYNDNVISAIKPFIAPEAGDNRIRDLFYSEEPGIGDQSYTDVGAGALVINLVLPETSDDKEIEKAITDAFDKYSDTLRREYPHTIKLADSEVMHIYHKGNVELMIRAFNDIDRIETSLKNKQSTLSDAQKSAVEKILSIKKRNQSDAILTEDMAHIDSQEKPSWSKKYTLMGFILGALLYALVYVCILIFRGRINSSADAVNYIGARLLGEICYKTERKGLFSIFHSDIVDKIRNRRFANEDIQIEKIKESMDAMCKHAGIKSITLLNLTKSNEDKVSNIIDNLTKVTTKVDIFEITDDIDEERLLNIRDAILVVGRDTTVTKLEELLGLCDDYDINIRSEIFIERR